jgi:uncharacterized iron-regulated protein
MKSLAIVLVFLGAAVLQAQSSYVPQRVFDTARGQFTDFEAMLADVVRADVVFVGEQHDDPNTHRLELAVLQGLMRRRGDVIVGMEMFERDVQDQFDHFQMGHTEESEFLQLSRPWPGYATDYKPLVDFAIARNWPVIASNVPRAVASEVSKSGLDVLQAKSDADKAMFAKDLQCPVDDDYFKRFGEAMGAHPGPVESGDDKAAAARQSLERYYAAQCLKDETMGESIARAWQTGAIGGKHPLVVHFNGAFHSDFAEGTVARVQRRLPNARVVVVTMMPVNDLDAVKPDADDLKRANYLVYTIGKG